MDPSSAATGMTPEVHQGSEPPIDTTGIGIPGFKPTAKPQDPPVIQDIPRWKW